MEDRYWQWRTFAGWSAQRASSYAPRRFPFAKFQHPEHISRPIAQQETNTRRICPRCSTMLFWPCFISRFFVSSTYTCFIKAALYLSIQLEAWVFVQAYDYRWKKSSTSFRTVLGRKPGFGKDRSISISYWSIQLSTKIYGTCFRPDSQMECEDDRLSWLFPGDLYYRTNK